MKITWITGRKIQSDLASSTEIGLIKSLMSTDNEIILISPDNKEIKFVHKHLTFDRMKTKGLQTYSGGLGLKKLFLSNLENILSSEIVIIDWRYVGSLNGLLKKFSISYCLIDRGPPAYSGLLAKIQKIFWKRNWLIGAHSKNCVGGFVVSPKHKEYVQRYIKNELPIGIIPAGTEIDSFTSLKRPPKNNISIIYVGRVDENRGMSEIIEFHDNIKDLKIPATIKIIGEGNYSKKFSDYSKGKDDFIFLGKKSRKEAWKEIDKSHVGIMPMPIHEIWQMASPIKLAEYAAAGLIIIGVNHLGNKLGEYDYSLLSGSGWEYESIGLLNDIIDNDSWEKLIDESKKSSIDYDWELIGTKMLENIRNWMN